MLTNMARNIATKWYSRYRPIVLNWCEEIQSTYDFDDFWINSVMMMLNTYIKDIELKKNDIQTLSCACIYIVTILHCKKYLTIEHLVWLTNDTCSVSDISKFIFLYISKYLSPDTVNLSNLKLIHLLGCGNSKVWLMESSERFYAIKEFCDPVGYSYFQELRALSYVHKHPNCIDFLGSCSSSDYSKAYIIYQYCDTSFYQFFEEKKTLKRIKCALFELLNVIAYAHSQHVSHRDIKPQNIMFNDNTLFLCDWDAATFADFNTELQTNPIVTLWYRSPELLRGSKCYTGGPIDIWSIGCCFYDMVMCQPLFRETSEEAVLELINRRNSWPVQLRSLLGTDGIDLLERCLEQDPFNRISAIEALKHPFFLCE